MADQHEQNAAEAECETNHERSPIAVAASAGTTVSVRPCRAVTRTACPARERAPALRTRQRSPCTRAQPTPRRRLAAASHRRAPRRRLPSIASEPVTTAGGAPATRTLDTAKMNSALNDDDRRDRRQRNAVARAHRYRSASARRSRTRQCRQSPACRTSAGTPRRSGSQCRERSAPSPT